VTTKNTARSNYTKLTASKTTLFFNANYHTLINGKFEAVILGVRERERSRKPRETYGFQGEATNVTREPISKRGEPNEYAKTETYLGQTSVDS
jgi:hypothetical protein